MGKSPHTPVMQQYLAFKRRHQDAVLLFRMGDFYEVFFEDAKVCARDLGLALTARSMGRYRPEQRKPDGTCPEDHATAEQP